MCMCVYISMFWHCKRSGWALAASLLMNEHTHRQTFTCTSVVVWFGWCVVVFATVQIEEKETAAFWISVRKIAGLEI